jgi:hypothetical protein
LNAKNLLLTLTLVGTTLLLGACGDLLDDDHSNANTDGGQGDGSLGFIGGDGADDDGASCGDYFDCAADCESEACSERCFNALSGRAQRQLGDLYGCAEDNNCDGLECVQDRCSSELESCIGERVSRPEPEPAPATGNGRCPDFFECASDCESDACYERCFESLRAREQQELLALIQCNSDHGCDDSSCLERNCGRELNACVN